LLPRTAHGGALAALPTRPPRLPAHPPCAAKVSCNPRTIAESGAPLLGSLGSPLATTLAGVFCIPASGSDLVNAIADLPGPAAISVAGSVSIQLL